MKTPRDEIQTHARVAADKIVAALKEFHAASGMKADLSVHWDEAYSIDREEPVHVEPCVLLRFHDEAHG